MAEGATITHHHGVGADHAPYLVAEKGPLGMAALEAIVRTFDPDGIMNPGVLLVGPPRLTARDADRILAIDVGTQSVRAMVFDPQGNLLARTKVPIEPYVPGQPGCCEQDPELYWRAIGEACAAPVGAARGPPRRPRRGRPHDPARHRRGDRRAG